jgi:hypothetical protein
MTAVVHLTAPRHLHPRVNVRTTTKREISTSPPSKPPLDKHRACHDAPPEARFARTAVYSTTLCAIPPHVVSIVRHACKLPPLAYKRRGSPLAAGGRHIALTHMLSAFATILALASIKNLRDLEDPPPLPPRL